MNKKQLIEALKDYPEDTEIALWRWTEDGSKWFYLNSGRYDPIKKRFDLLMSSEYLGCTVKKSINNTKKRKELK